MKKVIISLFLIVMLLTPMVSAACPVEPSPKLHTTIRNSHLMFVWNGNNWVPNPNYFAVWVGNRVYLTYY